MGGLDLGLGVGAYGAHGADYNYMSEDDELSGDDDSSGQLVDVDSPRWRGTVGTFYALLPLFLPNGVLRQGRQLLVLRQELDNEKSAVDVDMDSLITSLHTDLHDPAALEA